MKNMSTHTSGKWISRIIFEENDTVKKCMSYFEFDQFIFLDVLCHLNKFLNKFPPKQINKIKFPIQVSFY